MQTKRIAIFSGAALLLTCVGFWVVHALPHNRHLNRFVERRFPGLIPSGVYIKMLNSHSSDEIMTALYYLQKRRDLAGVPRAIQLLESDDDYVWLNAAIYLGACRRQECIPYLIKALRHTASRTDPETLQYLCDITGLNFSADFDRWQQWWLLSHPGSKFSWDTHLGYHPRIASPHRK